MKKIQFEKIIDCPCQCGQTYKSDVVMKDKQIYRIQTFAQEFSRDEKMVAGNVTHITLYECPNCIKK